MVIFVISLTDISKNISERSRSPTRETVGISEKITKGTFTYDVHTEGGNGRLGQNMALVQMGCVSVTGRGGGGRKYTKIFADVICE